MASNACQSTESESPFPTKSQIAPAAQQEEGPMAHDPSPSGSMTAEQDLSVKPINTLISICHESTCCEISECLYEDKLNCCMLRKEREDLMATEPAGLSWDIVRHLQSLKKIEKRLEGIEEKADELRNVKAVMKAYRAGSLTREDGISYWFEGQRLSKSEMWKRFRYWIENQPGLWVERMEVDDGSPSDELYLIPNGFRALATWT